MRRERRFTAEPGSVPAARRFALEVLQGTPLELRQSAELMVSELATNGVRHGRTSFHVSIQRTGEAVRVEVTDRGAGTPRIQFPGPDEPSGRGLQIVDMLAEEWGVEMEAAIGKTVWFTLSAEGAEEPVE